MKNTRVSLSCASCGAEGLFEREVADPEEMTFEEGERAKCSKCGTPNRIEADGERAWTVDEEEAFTGDPEEVSRE